MLKPKIINKDIKTLLLNFLSLTSLQAANYIFPLLTIPYLIRVLGIEKFGLITFAQVFISFFLVLTDYGFSLSATRDISINRENNQIINQIINTAFITKALMCLISFCILLTIVLFIPKFSEHKELYLYSFMLIPSQTFLPIWFFQGIEKMRSITILNFISKVIFTILIFYLIKNPSDYIYVNVINGFGFLISTIIAIVFLVKTVDFKLRLSSLNDIKSQLREGWHFFMTNATIHVSLSSNLFILGIFAPPIALGYYSIAEKVFLMVRTFASLLYQVVYPRACILAQRSFNEFKAFIFHLFIGIIIAFLPMCIIVFIFADIIVYWIAGEMLFGAVVVLRILSFAPLLAALNIPTAQSLLAFYHIKPYAFITSAAVCINVLLNIILAKHLFERGTALAALLTECFITISLYVYIEIYYKELSIFKNLKFNLNLKLR